MDEPRADSSGTASLLSTLFLVAALAAVALLGWIVYSLLRPTPESGAGGAAASLADPLLARGQAVYNDRCLGCHGPQGRGDGPISRSLKGPPPGDLTDGQWKHGDEVEQVIAVIRNGVEGTSMSGWGRWLPDEDFRGVVAYVYQLAGSEIPASLREQAPQPPLPPEQ